MNRFNLTPIVQQLLIACIVLFIGTFLLETRNINLNDYLALHYPKNPLFKPWQMLTHMFMHGGFTHLLFNMVGLVSFGIVLENFLGPKKFLTIFFISGFGALFLHLSANAIQLYQLTHLWFPSPQDLDMMIDGNNIKTNSPIVKSQEALGQISGIIYSQTVGASGAIYGIVAAFAFLFPNTKLVFLFIPYPIKAKYFVPIFIAIDLYLGFGNFKWDPIAHFAHVGGALFGFATVWYWRKFDKKNFF